MLIPPPENIKEWLDSDPHENEIIKQKNGSFTLPYIIVEDKLDTLTNRNWDTKNFIHRYHIINNTEAISASILLIVRYPKWVWPEEKVRKITGACTYPISFLRDMDGTAEESGNYNDHYAATAKSLCIVNAAKCLGRTFGKYLNNGTTAAEFSEAVTFHTPHTLPATADSIREGLKEGLKWCKTKKAALAFLSKSTTLHSDPELLIYIDEKYKN